MSYYGVYLGYANYATEYNRSQEFNEQPQERDTFELRLASSGDGKLQWMAGVYWEDIWDYWYYGAKHDNFKDTAAFAYATYAACYYDGAYGIDCPLPDNEVGYVNILDRSVEQTAIFAEISYDLTEKLTVTAGTRYAEITRDIYNLTHLPEGLPPAGLRDTYGIDTSKATEDETLYKLSANYAINDDVMVYGLFSQGFRVGGANSQRAHLYDPDTLPLEYDSDFMDNYELGIKSTWLDGRLMVNAQLFLMEWTDYQVTNYGGGDLPWWVYGNVNAETAESKGFELNLNWQVTDKLQLKSSFYAGKAQFTEDVVIGDDEYWDGMAMPNSPDRKAYLSLNYDIPGVFGGDMWLWYDISYVSDTWNRTYAIRANDKDGIAPAHHISNFQVGLDLSDGLSLTLRVENVWDQTEYTWASTSGKSRQAWFDTTQGYNERSLTQPRTVSFAVSKKF
jgi:outer membrane receptor protein involved in Fe transport